MNTQAATTTKPKLTRTEREENAVMRRVIRDALDAGCTLDVSDGEDTTVRGSTDARLVFAALRSTSEDKLTLRRDGVRVGWVLFVYGNSGEEVIADCTDNVAMDTILAGAEALAERYGSRR